MRVLVTGANGMLGIDVSAMLEEAGHEAIRTDVGAREGVSVQSWTPLDITNTQAVIDCIKEKKPDFVFHGAAYTDVDGCERNPDLAYKINGLGTWNIASACGSSGVKMIYISTDFVFDGKKTIPYTEFDSPNPLSHYGASKLAGEKYVAQLCREHFILRTSWLFGVNGPNFPGKMLDLAKTKPELSVVVDQIGSPTHTRDLARIAISQMDRSLYGTYHVSNSGSCSWYEFAKTAIEKAGIKNVVVHPQPAASWPSPTQRPAYSVMRHYALELQGRDDLKPWQEALDDFLALRRR